MRPWTGWIIGMLAACSGTSGDESGTTETTDTETTTPKPKPTTPTPTGETGTTFTTPGKLRPAVQQGPPNAAGQTPAFPEQTRAPQPAEDTAFALETVTDQLSRPWGFEILPDGRFLVNQKGGEMVVVSATGDVSAPIAGVFAVDDGGQGGLLDVALSPDFATSRLVFWTFSEPRKGGNGTSVARGVLSNDESELTDTQVIFRQQPAFDGSGHFGSRIAFAPDGNLFVTLGDRQSGSIRDEAQDPTNTIGSVVRIAPDGGIPSDNPFVGSPDGDDAIWSYGHRNPQSATLDLQGRLWTVEHGPQGGDELNRPVKGGNHGWPEVSYGEEYSGQPIGKGLTARADVEQPVYYWDPVIAPAGMAVYDGDLFDGWRGSFLIGGLQAQGVVRLQMRDDLVYTEEWLDIGTRVRDVRVAEDGAVYLATDNGEILRMVPPI